jgi:ubiquinone/menaquinone biosynthesis C-methylase UbiE
MNEFSVGKPPEEMSEEEKDFREYVEDLNITSEDFKKVILDVGAGEAHFAKWAKNHNISSEIYSLEPYGEMTVKDKALVASAEEIPLPDASIDLVFSNGAVPQVFIGEDDAEQKIRKSFSEMLRVLRDGGEIRLAHVGFGYKYENQRIFSDAVENLFKELQEKNNIQIERKHMFDSYEYEDGKPTNEVLAQVFDIVLKKPKKD